MIHYGGGEQSLSMSQLAQETQPQRRLQSQMFVSSTSQQILKMESFSLVQKEDC